jgi:hypothetical protein
MMTVSSPEQWSRGGEQMDRFRKVMAFLLLWLLAQIFWTFLLRTFTGHYNDKPAIQGLATDTIA